MYKRDQSSLVANTVQNKGGHAFSSGTLKQYLACSDQAIGSLYCMMSTCVLNLFILLKSCTTARPHLTIVNFFHIFVNSNIGHATMVKWTLVAPHHILY